MFRIESYITPILWSYYSKYVKNFNSHDFQVSLWEGGATFSNLDLNLDVLDSELQIPLTFASGHIQELKISVPWRKITSEPIVLNVKSMELVLKYRNVEEGKNARNSDDIAAQRVDPNRNDENAGYVRSLMSKIVSNVRVNFENVVIKYIESDIAFSVNVGEASLTPADENWNDAFIHRIIYSPDFILRKKLSFSDVNICLDRCNNAGLVDKFHDPMLYRCDFDVRIIQKFATSYSRVPYYYRMDLFLGHLQFNVTDEQIPMLVRLYNLFTWLMQSGSTTDASKGAEVEEPPPARPASPSEAADQGGGEGPGRTDDVAENLTTPETQSWTSWAQDWLYTIPLAVFGEESEDAQSGENLDRVEGVEGNQTTPPPSPPPGKKPIEEFPQVTPTTHFGVYIKTLTIIFKAVQRSCDRPLIRRKIINIFPFLKCSIQGICCDFIVRGNENSHACGVSSIMVHGLGFCPCGVQDCTSSEGGSSSQGGECYFEAGTIKEDFLIQSLFQATPEAEPVEWCYDVNHKELLNFDAESAILAKTPAFFMKYIVTRSEEACISEANSVKSQSSVISEILYHGVAAPCKILLCSGLVHRLKMVNDAINNYGYEPYGAQIALTNIPNPRCLLFTESSYPITSYRLVIRQPLIEILAADHPSDYSREKRAEYFRKSGGVINVRTLPRLSPEWPKMVISCDIMECTAEDSDGHFNRLRDRLLEEPSADSPRYRQDSPQGEDASGWVKAKAAKKATIAFSIKEVLVTFISEPVELNIGVKSGSILLEFSNYKYVEGTIVDFLHRINGDILLETVTCSTRLEQRSNILWLPLTVRVNALLDWESKLFQPSLSLEVRMDSLIMYVGPETIIAFSQLTEKLVVYAMEFLPYLLVTAPDPPNLPLHARVAFFTSRFDTESLKSLMESNASHLGIPEVGEIGICTSNQTVVWRFPQKRTIRNLIIKALPHSFAEFGFDEESIKLELEWFEEFTGDFYHCVSFTLRDRAKKTVRLANDSQRNIGASSVWRIRITSALNRSDSLLVESVAKSLTVESMIYPEFKIALQVPVVSFHLVNNTCYTGKEISNAVLKSYANTEGVSPADHVLANVDLGNTILCLTSTEAMTRCTTDFTIDIRVLDYESLVLEQIIDPVFVGLVLSIPDSHGNCALSVVSQDVTLRIGASFVHSLTYSAALWNQVIHSYDSKTCKMVATENRPKIILNRMLICNDLNFEIDVRFPQSNSLGNELIPSKDCKAVSCPGGLVCEVGSGLLDPPVKIDMTKTGYHVKKSGNEPVFVHVSNLSASQKLAKISGSLIFANGLDQPIEVSMAVLNPTVGTTETSIPSRGVGPTHLKPLEAIKDLKFRIASSDDNPNPWSDSVNMIDLKQRLTKPVVSVFLTLWKRNEQSPSSKMQVWLTVVTETIEDYARNLIVVTPIYCLRSWLCGETLIHLNSAEESQSDLYKIKGKGDEIQIMFTGERDVTRHMTFQSSPEVPPSLSSVPLLPAGPLLEQNKLVRPIDDLLAQLTGTSTNLPVPIESSEEELKWPFVDQDVCIHDWNTEINPETEIMVSFTPWVEGLPTAVADIRPWALFINLSGVELLFAQETEGSEWDQFWVPYKCVFSPKRVAIPSGKFKLGIMMNDFLVKSPALEFSDQPERLSVKRINKDGKVPLDCYSRLDLFGGSQVACLTIESRIRNKILVLTVRPTYSIQNRAPIEIYAEGITISAPVTQRRELWVDSKLSGYTTLEACLNMDAKTENTTAMPILHFTTDGQDYSAKTPSYKYLALSCGGPWWFVQLVDCSELASDRNPDDGIPGTKIAVTLPKVDCTILSPLYRHKLKTLTTVSEPVVVGSYTKNGQVWISVSQDNAPQLIIHNKTTLPLFCVEKDAKNITPRHLTSCFEQYLMAPPRSTCHFSFHNAYHTFPQLNKREVAMPDMLLACVSQDLVDFVTSSKTQSFTAIMERPRQVISASGQSKTPAGNLLFPDFDIEWQGIVNVHNNPTQYATFGQKSVKISVEIVGYTYHVFIENAKVKEVSANYIRSRFTVAKPSKGRRLHGTDEREAPIPQRASSHGSGASVSDTDIERAQIGDAPLALVNYQSSDGDEDGPPSPPAETEEDLSQAIRPWRIKVYIPELYVSIQEDISGGTGNEREFLGLTFETINIEQVPIIEDSKLRPAECPRRESWIYTVRVGNIQADTPSMNDRDKCEFPVLLQPKKKSSKINDVIPRSGFAICHFLDMCDMPNMLNLDSTITITRVAPTEINLETVWVKARPVSVFIEDRLLSYVVPSVQHILNVFNEGYLLWLESAAAVSSVCGADCRDDSTFDSGETAQILIVDSEAVVAPTLFYSNAMPGTSNQRKGTSSSEVQNIFSRNISFAPTLASSSSGLNSSSSSVISSTLSNLRLASVSPPPPSPLTPLEPHGVGGSARMAVKWPEDTAQSMSVETKDETTKEELDLFVVKPVKVPKELIKLFEQLSHPVRLKMVDIQPTEVELTLRTEKLMYVALDRSVVQLRGFKAYTSVTTDFHLGLEITMHYTVGTIFTIGNPVRVLGSLELLGSPGTLARTVGTGLRDLVVYPYEGILNGPVGFVSGLGYGVASLLRSVTSGSLVSLTNWAQSVSRNIDRLTLDQQEQLVSESIRQVELQGFTDGFVQGLSGFGIRILGAIGGLTRHPLSVVERSPTTSGVITGVGRGVLGVVVKPIGGIAEFISMTGQGVLLATGWKPRLQAKKPKKKGGEKKKNDSITNLQS